MHTGTKKRVQVDTDEAYSPERTRLGWLTELANLAPDGIRKLSTEEQRKWRERLYDFPRGMVESPGGGADAITLEQIDELAKAAREMLNSWHGGQSYFLRSQGLNVRWLLTKNNVKLMGDFASMFKLEAMWLLAGDDAKKWLRRCPSCRRLFAARKNAAYCSPKCSNREEKRRYRVRLRERAMGRLKPLACTAGEKSTTARSTARGATR